MAFAEMGQKHPRHNSVIIPSVNKAGSLSIVFFTYAGFPPPTLFRLLGLTCPLHHQHKSSPSTKYQWIWLLYIVADGLISLKLKYFYSKNLLGAGSLNLNDRIKYPLTHDQKNALARRWTVRMKGENQAFKSH